MKTSKSRILISLSIFGLGFLSLNAQNKKAIKDTIQVPSEKKEAAANVMLNASSDAGPRSINIGLPGNTTGTTISENGLLVTYDPQGSRPVRAWRQDGSFSKINSLSLIQTAILYGDIGASVATYTNKGTEKLQGRVNFNTNSFGLLRGSISISGPLKNNWYYAVNAFVNMDPDTYRSNIDRFMEQTHLYKGFLNKKYNGGKGEIGFQYKYANSKGINNKYNPYMYRKDGTVEALPGMSIGKEAYLSQTGNVNVINVLTGEREMLNMLDDTGSETHAIDILGKNKLGNGLNLDYVVRYNHTMAGFFNSAYNKIFNTDDMANNVRYIYADNPNNQVYTGYVQNAMFVIGPKSKYQTLQSRIDLSKNTAKHKWMFGLSAQYYMIDDANKSTVSYIQEVANNPRQLIRQTYNGTDWVNANNADEFGQWNYNGSFQYYDGAESKTAIYFTDNWIISQKLNLELGARLEWQNINGNWYSQERRDASSDKTWVSGGTDKVKKDWLNKNISATFTYKANKSWGVTADAHYFEVAGNLSAYAGADDPQIKTSKVPYFAGGIYFNSKHVSLVSRISHIMRTNNMVNGNFNSSDGQSMKKTINYDVKTLGWTTDAIVKPFKGFDLHLLLTLQNPKYDKFKFDVYGEEYDYGGLTVRSVSKTIIEIDPSYSWSKFKIWASARYFSKEYANFPNSLTFAGRWETFAGFDYKYNKHVNFSINAVNLLNQSGAQGNIAGSNTMLDGADYYDKPLTGTYIRPFTIEFKTNVRF